MKNLFEMKKKCPDLYSLSRKQGLDWYKARTGA